MYLIGSLLDGTQTLLLQGVAIDEVTLVNSLYAVLVYIVFWLGSAILIYLLLASLFISIEKLDMAKLETFFVQHGNNTNLKRIWNKHSCLMYAIILILCWAPYIVYFFPGCITSDMSRQLAIYFGGTELPRNNFFPWLVSMVYGGIYSAGTILDKSGTLGLFLLTILQATIATYIFSTITKWIQKITKSEVLTLLSLLFFCIFPLIPTYIVSINKDSLHALLFAFFTLQLFLHAFSQSHSIPYSVIYRPISLVIVGLLVSLTRNNGIYIVLPALLCAAVLYKRKSLYAAMAAVLALFIGWNVFLLPALHVAPGNKAEACSLPLQIIASQVAHNENLTEKDLADIQKYLLLNPDEIKQLYNPRSADEVKRYAQIQDWSDIVGVTKLAVKLASKNPIGSIGSALNTTHEAWYPTPNSDGTYHYEYYPYITEDDDWTRLASWYSGSSKASERVKQTNMGSTALFLLRNIAPFSYLYTPGVYCWLLMTLAIYAIYKKTLRKSTCCILVPAFMLELVLIAAPVASLRYALPLVLSLPIYLLAFYSITIENTSH